MSRSPYDYHQSCPNFVFGLRSSIARQQQLFLSEYRSDVIFQVSSTGKLIHAHKLILTLASEVFYAQFNGSFKESYQSSRVEPVEVEDIEPPTFTEVLRFIYCEKVSLSADNILDIHYAAQKYLLTDLIAVCKDFFHTNINEENVLKIFNGNLQYGVAEVDEVCLKIIRGNPIKLFQLDQFQALSQPALELIAASRHMNCEKEHLCEAIEKWREYNNVADDIVPKLESSNCRKLVSYSTFQYTPNVYTNLKIIVQKKLDLHGVGIFVKVKTPSNCSALVNLTISNESGNTSSVTKIVDVCMKQDKHVMEIMFEKVIIETKCNITVTVKEDCDSPSSSEFLCMDEFTPIDTLESVNIETAVCFTEDSTNGCRNCVAYLLYNVDDGVDKK